MFLFKPAEKTGEKQKFTRLFQQWTVFGDVQMKFLTLSGHQTPKQPNKTLNISQLKKGECVTI